MCLRTITNINRFYKIFSHKDNKLWPAFRNSLDFIGIRDKNHYYCRDIEEYKPFDRRSLTNNCRLKGRFHAFLNLRDAKEVVKEEWSFTKEEKIILEVTGTIVEFGLFGMTLYSHQRPAAVINDMHIKKYVENADQPIKYYDLT